ncbi:MAG: hypothetical protein II173_04365 [Firmicutes bacterium]|nr:hypothetical protein [Bacillota bacterium]
MKKTLMCLLIALLAVCLLAGCGEKKWSREGYFMDENENMLIIYPSEDSEHPGWSVGLITDGKIYGNYIKQDGKALKGNIVPDYEEGEFNVTVSEEGKDGVMLAVDGGETYHFLPYEMPEPIAQVTINTEGMGNIAYAEGTGTPEVDEEYPYQSSVMNIAEPTTYTILAYPDKGWKFVKWTKNGEDISTEPQITVEVGEDSDFVAVFDVDEDYVDPLEVLNGSYSAGRPGAEVEVLGDSVFVSIHWANSASEASEWIFAGQIDEDTMGFDYENAPMKNVVYDSNGDVIEEKTVYEDGSGSITFAPDGSSFTWHDDKSEREDLVFEKLPDQGE